MVGLFYSTIGLASGTFPMRNSTFVMFERDNFHEIIFESTKVRIFLRSFFFGGVHGIYRGFTRPNLGDLPTQT